MARLARAIFPLALWLFATLLLGGDLGRWNDDYEFNQRVPETGQFERLTEPMEGQFWRPLFFSIVPALQTLCWDYPRVNHAIQGAAHGLAAMALWWMLGTLGVSRRVRTPLALLFVSCPIAFQAIFWSASLPTILSAGVFMVLLGLYAGWVRGRGGAGRALAMIALGVLIPLMNEQPAPVLAVFPLLWLGARDGTDDRRIGIVRAAWPIAVLGLAYAAYLGAYLATSPPGYPATGATLVHADQIWPRARQFVHRMGECIAMGGRAGWFLDSGWRAVAGGGLWAWALGAAMLGSGIVWGAGAPDRSRADHAEQRNGPFGPVWLLVFGAAVVALAWSPVLVITTYEPASRLFYAPLVGAAIIAGVIFDRLATVFSRASLVAAAARGAVVAACVLGAVLLAGAQRGFRQQHYVDAAYGEQLRALVRAPTPGTFFVPVRIDDPAFLAPDTWLDANFHSILCSSFNVRMWIKFAMARSDVYCGTYSPDRSAYPTADERGLGYAWKFVDRAIAEDPSGVWRVPWPSVVPFEIDRGGNVAIVSRIVLERADNSDLSISVNAAPPGPARTCAWYDHSADVMVRPLGAWTWGDGSGVVFERPRCWASVHSAVRMGGEDVRRGVMRTALPRTPAITTLYFRVTADESDVAMGAGARVEWALESGEEGPIDAIELTPAVMGAERRWLPVTLTVPPHPDADWSLRVRVVGLPDAGAGAVLVTSGLWSARLP